MKRNIAALMLILLGCVFTSICVKADTNIEGIKLDEQNFPDEYVRAALYDFVDQDGDYILQQNEIKEAEFISISVPPSWREDIKTDEGHPLINLKGIGVFKNLKSIVLISENKDNESRGFLNFNEIYRLKKLKKIYIEGDAKTNSYKFGKFAKLEELSLSYIYNNKITIKNKRLAKLKMANVKCNSINISRAGNVKKMRISFVKTKALDFSHIKRLKEIEMIDVWAENLKFGKLRKLKKISIWSNTGMNNRSTRYIDVSEVKNLEQMQASDLSKLNTIKFGKQNKLKRLDIGFTNGKQNRCLKTINISKLKNLKYLHIDNYAKLEKIVVERNKKIKELRIEKCKKLQKYNY